MRTDLVDSQVAELDVECHEHPLFALRGGHQLVVGRTYEASRQQCLHRGRRVPHVDGFDRDVLVEVDLSTHTDKKGANSTVITPLDGQLGE